MSMLFSYMTFPSPGSRIAGKLHLFIVPPMGDQARHGTCSFLFLLKWECVVSYPLLFRFIDQSPRSQPLTTCSHLISLAIIFIETWNHCSLFQPLLEFLVFNRCASTSKAIPKDKAIKRFSVRNIVDASALRDIRDASAYDNYALPKLYIKQYYSVEAAVHQRIVRVRSATDRRIRTPPARGPRKF